MPSCLGIRVEKNLIKYAKMTKDKTTSLITVNSFGIKFYDSLSDTIHEIVSETQSEMDTIALGLSSEDYTSIEVFNGLSPKDAKSLIKTQFDALCDERNVNKAALDMRYVLVKNTEKADTYKAICIVANKVELTNIGQILATYKLGGITSMGTAVASLFRNKGIGESMAIVDIGDDTKVTVFDKGELADLITIPIGMDEVITKLADRYNSYSKAYEACKGVNAYGDSDLVAVDDETKEINDILLPVLYDLKQRVVMALEGYDNSVNDIYITGTGTIINNIDLYLQDGLNGKKCELLLPYFIDRGRNNIKDIMEVTDALAVAAYGLDGADKNTDFYVGGGYLKAEADKARREKFSFATLTKKAKNWVDDVNNKMKRPVNHKKRQVSFDDEVEQLDQLGGAGETAKSPEPEEMYDPVDEWLTRLAISAFVAFIAYSGMLWYTNKVLDDKISLADERIKTATGIINKIENDSDYISAQANDYKSKTDKLAKILEAIRSRTERTFNIPNLLSRLMFAIPADVKVTSVKVLTDNTVTMSAESGKYAQLGYFVSRLKIENILKDVNMQVVSMNGTIKIIVNGVLP